MHLVRLELSGFKSFAKKTSFDFASSVVAIVGPNGSGKSNVAEAIRFVLGEQSMKSMRGKRGEDLIWNGSAQAPRANRAGVALTFDNRSRFLDIDFDEVVVERIVNRDGTNDYRLNGSAVRLKDILELLASANIGQTGHHIISQGEADKILSASPKERREMLEDALGLKVYQFKLSESTRKLDKTEENIRQVEALRREVAPHLRFLKRQVEKVQRVEELKRDAVARFREYFAREHQYVTTERVRLDAERARLDRALTDIASRIVAAREALAASSDSKDANALVQLSSEIEQVRSERRTTVAEAARLEGTLAAFEQVSPHAAVPREALEELIREHETRLSNEATSLEALSGFVRSLFEKLKALLRGNASHEGDTAALQASLNEARTRERSLAEREQSLASSLEELRKTLDNARTEERTLERSLFTLTSEERELRHALDAVVAEERTRALREAEYKREVGEVMVLVGREAVALEGVQPSDLSEEAHAAEARELQKIKIRLEEMGAGGSGDVLKEYEEANEREQFLIRELEDLARSSESLKGLIADLERELSERFKQGLHAINAEFTKFFALMFDGGSASLVLTREPVRRLKSFDDENDDGVPDELQEGIEGIEIALTIPRKRIKSLTMLSGGERALTSIALIFAMSSVNPPPFLVLDETDAALDEANSRRYGDMISALSEKSQLVLITHNRETMSRAGILYGVTMGGDGVSKVLSVKLEEAVQVAK